LSSPNSLAPPQQILGLAQLVEIFEEEPVLTVVTSSPLRTALQQIVGQQRTDRRDHSAHPVVFIFGDHHDRG
jgi:hypothetical protein